jgi:hypothetical protein
MFQVSVFSPAAGHKNGRQIEKETLNLAIVGSATVPTAIGGHGGPPYFTKIASKFVKLHTRCQDLAPRFPDTRNLTPETYNDTTNLHSSIFNIQL